MCVSDAAQRHREAAAPPPPSPRVSRAAAAGAAAGRHEQEGGEAPGGLADPIRQALWVTPGLQEPLRVVPVLIFCGPLCSPPMGGTFPAPSWEQRVGRGVVSVSRPWHVPVAASCFSSLTYNLCLLVFGPGSWQNRSGMSDQPLRHAGGQGQQPVCWGRLRPHRVPRHPAQRLWHDGWRGVGPRWGGHTALNTVEGGGMTLPTRRVCPSQTALSRPDRDSQGGVMLGSCWENGIFSLCRTVFP